jgi:hypothetical protein
LFCKVGEEEQKKAMKRGLEKSTQTPLRLTIRKGNVCNNNRSEKKKGQRKKEAKKETKLL